MIQFTVQWLLAHLPKSERGQDVLEYALLGGMITAAIVAVVAAGLLSGALDSMFTNISKCVDFDKGTVCIGGL